MCSNCALRSGCVAPSCRLRGDCSRYPSRCSSRPTVVELTRHPCSVSAGRQLRATLARPAQRRGRVAARERIHQRFERGLDAGLILLDAGPTAPRASDAVRRRFVAGNLPASLANRLPSQTRGRRNHRVAAVADGTRLGRRPPAPTALVQHRRDHGILRQPGSLPNSISRFIPPVWPEIRQLAN